MGKKERRNNMERTLDKIEMHGMVFLGRHGVKAEERNKPQRFRVDVDMYLDLAHAGESDTMADTANYSLARKKVQAIIEGESCFLIERLANLIAEEILYSCAVDGVTVGVWKLDVWPE